MGGKNDVQMESSSFVENQQEVGGVDSSSSQMLSGSNSSNDFKLQVDDESSDTTSNGDRVTDSLNQVVTESSDVNMRVKTSQSICDGFFCVEKMVLTPRRCVTKFLTDYKRLIGRTLWILFAIGITVYTFCALLHDRKSATPLLVLWIITAVFKLYALLQSLQFACFTNCSRRILDFYEDHRPIIVKLFIFCVVALALFWIIFDTMKRPEQLISGVGYFVFLAVLFVCSKYPQDVRVRPVFWGCLIQITLAFIVLRTDSGFHFFSYVGDLVQTFINYVDTGVAFVFGASFYQHFFAFKVLSIVVYFSSFISILYYLGAMQWLIMKIAWLMQKTLGTSATESMVAAGNIFVGQTEAPLLIRPYIEDLTTSELHSVMVCGFGTVSGSVLGAYLGFGIKPVYVITACVMAAPCALAVSKIVYPETKQSKFSSPEGLKLEKGAQRNIIEAAFQGAEQAVPLVLNIGANLVAFLALLAALNGFLEWLSSLTGFHVNFQIACSYLFYPVALLLGIESTYAKKIGELIGTKVFINEFIAYEKLADMIELRDNGTYPLYDPNGALNWVDERSEAIVTYALCGFANFGSLGIMLGGLGGLAPRRQSEMAKIVVRALICGIFVSILNACIAGFLYEPQPINCMGILHQDSFDSIVLTERLHQCCSRPVTPELFLNNETVSKCNAYNWTVDFTQRDFLPPVEVTTLLPPQV